MYVCVFVYMSCVCVCVCVCVCTFAHMHYYSVTCISTYTHIRSHVCVHRQSLFVLGVSRAINKLAIA